MYDPLVGRFLEEDPDGFAAGDPDLYRYVGNHPTNATDPSGLQPEPKAEKPDPRIIDLGEEISDKGTSQKLQKPEFPFEGGTGKVEVFTGVKFATGLSNIIRLKFSADVPVENAHWLQVTRSMVFTPKNEPKLDKEQRIFPICTTQKDTVWSIRLKAGQWHVDTARDNTAYYDESGGVYYREKHEISIFDLPGPQLGQFTDKGTYEIMDFQAYLVSNGKVYYKVTWSVTMTEIREDRIDSYIDYSYEVGGSPVTVDDLDKFLKTDKLLIGPANALIPKEGEIVSFKPPRLVTIPNPINLKPEK